MEYGASYTIWLGDSGGTEITRAGYASSTVGCDTGSTCSATLTVDLAAGTYNPQ